MNDSTQLETIYQFTAGSNLRNWHTINDTVMGGVSYGHIKINEEGNGVFTGKVSLKNNGGFCSVRYPLPKRRIGKFHSFVLKVYGDDKAYQFRIKENSEDAHVYKAVFKTTKQWQEIKIRFDEMFPSFRGQKLNKPNFSGQSLEEIAFLIANKEEEHFKLLINRIKLM